MANVAPEPVVRTGLTAGGKWIRTLGPTEDAGRPWPVSVHVRADYLSLPGTQAEATSAGLETLVVSRGTENPASSSSESYKPVPVMIGLDAATPITCSQLSSSDLDRAHPIGLQRVDLSSPCTCCGFPSFLFSLGFRFGDSFALPLKHQFTLEAGDSADDGEHQVAGRCAGIAEIQDAEVGPLGFHAFGDFEQMPCRARERAGNDCSMIGEELCRPRKQWRTV